MTEVPPLENGPRSTIEFGLGKGMNLENSQITWTIKIRFKIPSSGGLNDTCLQDFMDVKCSSPRMEISAWLRVVATHRKEMSFGRSLEDRRVTCYEGTSVVTM